MRAQRVFDTLLHRRQGPQVEDEADVRHRAEHGVRVAEVALDHFRSGTERREIEALAGAEVIEDAHRSARGEQRFDQV